MGFATQRQAGANYVSVGHGFLLVRTTKGDSYNGVLAQSRELGGNGPTKGTTVFELNFPSYEGLINNVRFSRAEQGSNYGDQVYFDVEDDTLPEDDRFRKITIQVPLDSRYVTKFVQVFGNLNPSDPVAFEPWQLPKEDKPDEYITGWGFRQDGQKVKDHILKEDMPEIVKYMDRGKQKVDNRDLLDYVERELIAIMKEMSWDEFHPDYVKPEPRQKYQANREPSPTRERSREPQRSDRPAERTREPAPPARERERAPATRPAPNTTRSFAPTKGEEEEAEAQPRGRSAAASRFVDPDDEGEGPPY